MLGGVLGSLFGKKAPSAVSNGGLSAGAGNIPSAVASELGAKSGNGSGGVQVQVINQGSPMEVSSTSTSGGDGLEQRVISIVVKDAESMGTMTQSLGGAIKGIFGG